MSRIRRTRSNAIQKDINSEYSIQTALGILHKYGNRKINSTRKISVRVVDDFLLSGKFNSALGLDGFTNYKKCLKDIVSKINDNNFSANIINLDIMFEALLDSGLYFNDEYVPESLKENYGDVRWLTAYRYIAKNFPDMNYKDYRTIVKRFEETRGYSFYIDETDTKYLKKVAEKKGLFEEVVDGKAELMQLNSKELREICSQLEIQASRSQLETANRIIESKKEYAQLLPQKNKSRKNLRIVDQELAEGNDLINIDKYLRAMAKEIRADFSNYILDKRFIKILGDKKWK